jgi:hypothetical protein
VVLRLDVPQLPRTNRLSSSQVCARQSRLGPRPKWEGKVHENRRDPSVARPDRADRLSL